MNLSVNMIYCRPTLGLLSKRNIELILVTLQRRIAHRQNTDGSEFLSQTNGKLEWSYLQGAPQKPLLGITIGRLLQQRAESDGDKEAYVFCHQKERLNFAQLLEQSDQLAAGLIKLGIKRGDRVGIWAPNYLEWILAQYATARAGFILVNINPAYRVKEVEFAIRQVGLRAIICVPEFKTQKYYEMLLEICPEIAHSSPGNLRAHRLPNLQVVVLTGEKNFPGTLNFSEVMDMGSTKERAVINNIQDRLQFDDPINIQFTSGTTGLPKGATLSHFNIVNNSLNIGRILGYHERESRICVPVPLYHCFGMVIASLQAITHGACCVFPSPSFEPTPAIEAVHQERCTSLYGTPTMFIDMLNQPDLEQYDFTSLYTGVMAGSPCPSEIMKKVVEILHISQMTICYGTTENSPVTFQTSRTDPYHIRVNTIGRPHPHVEVKVIDSDGQILRVNETGELCTRGYMTMLYYWGEEEKTKHVIMPDRWYRTGDLARLDENGYGQIVGRIRDMIVRGGENVYPVEIEQFLYKHPGILDVQVVGVPDARLGEDICAWVKVKSGYDLTADDVKKFCKGQIAHFKIPKYILFVDEFPMTVTGKVQKYKMQQDSIKLLGLEAN